MNISKEEFVEVINEIKEAMELWDKIEDLTANSSCQVGCQLEITHQATVIRLLELLTFDKSNTICWWIYETDFGKRNTEIYNSDDSVMADIKTAEDLYDYLYNCFVEVLEDIDCE